MLLRHDFAGNVELPHGKTCSLLHFKNFSVTAAAHPPSRRLSRISQTTPNSA
jgi:hypothetical protein